MSCKCKDCFHKSASLREDLTELCESENLEGLEEILCECMAIEMETLGKVNDLDSFGSLDMPSEIPMAFLSCLEE